eukprot:TRINITY_DN11763_c0_g1_i2.p1 TRINITY_DN11763_c0_g1~~TRINITY_DN11763_c0_g1_i2.p1  ORF type:complete len:214 (+),score=28.68 TRINITY_DN11763_c0_g1_i2:518-1159(+)
MLMDEGSVFDSGTATHHLTLYKHKSGAIVFGAGTCQWSWGLDANHDSATGVPAERANGYSIRVGKDQQGPDLAVQQATINLFADMHIYPTTLTPELVQTSASQDSTAPSCRVESCVPLDSTGKTSFANCTGVATDSGGHVAAVEISLNGIRWHPATIESVAGVTGWFYFTGDPHSLVQFEIELSAEHTVQCRAADDSGNLGQAGSFFWQPFVH